MAESSRSLSDHLTNAVRFLAGPPGRLLARMGVSPNAVTLLAIGLNLVVALLIGLGKLSPFAIGALILGVGFLDAIDGTVARTAGKVSAFGGVLDAVGDRFSEGALLVGLLAAATARDEVLYTAAALATFPLVSYVRAKAESLGIKVSSGLANRTLRILLLGLSFWFGLYRPVIALLAALSLVTALHRMILLRRLLAGR